MAVLAGCGGTDRAVPFTDVTRQLRGFEPPRLTRVLLTSQAELESYFRHESPGTVTHVPRIDWSRPDSAPLGRILWKAMKGKDAEPPWGKTPLVRDDDD